MFICSLRCAEIYGEYERLIAERFPFTVGSEEDLPLEDFEDFFGPEGILDKFYHDELLVFVDENSGNPKEIAGNALSVESEFIESIKDTQRQILSDYSKMVKPGGKMVYATCSILPSENEKQIEHF